MKWERIVFKKNLFTPPLPPPTLGIKNQNKGIEDILDIDSHCPYPGLALAGRQVAIGSCSSHSAIKIFLL